MLNHLVMVLLAAQNGLRYFGQFLKGRKFYPPPLVRPFYSEAADVVFEAHWVLMETKIKRIVLDWEHEDCQWINSKKIPMEKVVPWLPTLIEYLLAKAEDI